jgi:glycosyltransferase involved in cell wall biosynthesis
MFKDPKAIAQWYFALSAKRRKSALQPKTNDIPATITRLEDLTTYRHVDRAPYYQALSTLEKARENPLIAAVYATRLLRWQDQQQAKVDIAGTVTALQTKGYHAEAEALQAIYGEHGSAEQQLAYLQNKLARHKQKPELPLEILDDRRAKPRYKVSVIVSLYNAASKLPTFFRMLDQQTLIKQGEIEVVLIDSGSPADEYSAFKHYQGPLKNAVVFARSEKRETIQAAWNRGIKLCRGEYLTFQAVDEALHPECLTILSNELDKNPDVDWIMGSAIVAEINKQEILLSDVMTYNRSDAKQHSPILDGTYVNYTPGLYRKRVHELHGYYDESFAAAGDTEFKNRVLPFITLKFIPDVLGAYNNYQEERTTAHPRAEIEDIRAWYLFRTPAGIEYLFQNKSETALLDLLRDTLGYRKAYCTHLSTDIELGLSVATYLHKKTGNARYQTWVNQFQQLIALCRQVESLPTDKPAIMTMIRATGTFTQIKKRLGRELKLAKLPTISLFHDNRYEQHWWPWRNTI